METLLSQMQQFGQGAAQIWQDQLARWERATEAAFAAQRAQVARWGDAVETSADLSGKLGRAWLDQVHNQMHDLYARWGVVQDGVTSANTSTPPRT